MVYVGKLPVDSIVEEAPRTFTTVTSLISGRVASNHVRIAPTQFAICGSDLHYSKGSPFSPRCIGHEWVGRVREVGDGIQGLREGELVVGGAFLGCLKCAACARGATNYCGGEKTMFGFSMTGAGASFVDLRPEHCIAATTAGERLGWVAEPLGVAIEAAATLGNLQGKKIALVGAGLLGLLTADAIRQAGGEVHVVDLQESRARIAETRGFDVGYREDRYDILIDVAGDCGFMPLALPSLISRTERGGCIVVLGKYPHVPALPLNIASERGISLRWVRGSNYRSIAEAVRHVPEVSSRLRLTSLTREFSPHELSQAYAEFEARGEILRPCVRLRRPTT